MTPVTEVELQPLPSDLKRSQLFELRGIVTNPELLNAARGLNPSIRPGSETLQLLKDTIKQGIEANPKLLERYSELQLQEAQIFWVNNYVKTQGLVNPVYIAPTNSGYLPSTELIAREFGGRNQLLVVVFFVAAVLYAIRRMLFKQKAEVEKEKLFEKLIEDNL